MSDVWVTVYQMQPAGALSPRRCAPVTSTLLILKTRPVWWRFSDITAKLYDSLVHTNFLSNLFSKVYTTPALPLPLSLALFQLPHYPSVFYRALNSSSPFGNEKNREHLNQQKQKLKTKYTKNYERIYFQNKISRTIIYCHNF